MKKISIAIVIAMLLSALSVFAAGPQIDYIFYHPEEKTFYAFGRYDKLGIKQYNTLDHVGLYLGNDYSVKYPLTDAKFAEQISDDTNVEPKFGIGFNTNDYNYFDDQGGFAVTPYKEFYLSGTEKGSTKEMAITSTTPLNTNARAREISFVSNLGGYHYGVMLNPKFDPDVYTYTVNTHLNATVGGVASYKLFCVPEDSAATYVVTDDTDNKVKTLTVTAPDGETTKTYTFNFVNSYTNNNVIEAVDSAYLEYNRDSKSYVNYFDIGNNANYFDANARVDKYGGNYRPVISFDISELKTALENAGNIIFAFTGKGYNAETYNKSKNFLFNMYGVTAGVDYDEDGEGGNDAGAYNNVAYDRAAIETTDVIGSTTIIKGWKDPNNTAENDTSEFARYFIDVTDYVKARAAAGDDYITIMLALDGFEFVEDFSTYTTFRIYNHVYSTKGGKTGTNSTTGPKLLYY